MVRFFGHTVIMDLEQRNHRDLQLRYYDLTKSEFNPQYHQ